MGTVLELDLSEASPLGSVFGPVPPIFFGPVDGGEVVVPDQVLSAFGVFHPLLEFLVREQLLLGGILARSRLVQI